MKKKRKNRRAEFLAALAALKAISIARATSTRTMREMAIGIPSYEEIGGWFIEMWDLLLSIDHDPALTGDAKRLLKGSHFEAASPALQKRLLEYFPEHFANENRN